MHRHPHLLHELKLGFLRDCPFNRTFRTVAETDATTDNHQHHAEVHGSKICGINEAHVNLKQGPWLVGPCETSSEGPHHWCHGGFSCWHQPQQDQSWSGTVFLPSSRLLLIENPFSEFIHPILFIISGSLQGWWGETSCFAMCSKCRVKDCWLWVPVSYVMIIRCSVFELNFFVPFSFQKYLLRGFVPLVRTIQ